MKIVAVLLGVGLVVMASGCFTPRHVDRLRAKQDNLRAKQNNLMRVEAREGVVYAGADIVGVKEAIQVDPWGTLKAMGKDVLSGTGIGLGTAWVASELSNDGGGGGKSAKPNVPNSPAIQADTVIYNQGSGSVNYSAGNNSPAQ